MSRALAAAAQHHLLSYCKLVHPAYTFPEHIVQIAHLLEAVERGTLKRLIITIPPRHGKSMLGSQFFPAWYLGRHPTQSIITATYGQELSDDFGRKVRDQMEDPLYRWIFDLTVRQDSRAVSRFATAQGGEYFAVGAGGPITGRGAHLLLIDDPVKDREHADSETHRSKLIEWYKSVAYTRLMPDGAIVLIMTRWHEEDLVAHLMQHMAHEGWHKVDLPAIAHEGTTHEQALWPEAYALDTLQTIRKTLSEGPEGPYAWHCLYQQNPIPKCGNVIHTEWLRSGLPEKVAATYIGCDLAIGEQDHHDETAFTVWQADYQNPAHYYEVETQHGHWDFNTQVDRLIMLHAKYKTHGIGVENVQYQKALIDVAAKHGLPVHKMPADTDKVRRAMAVSHFFSQGRVHVNTPALREQLLRFRGQGERNDLADATFHCLRLIRDWTTERYELPPQMRVPDKPLHELRLHDVAFRRYVRHLKQQAAERASADW